MRTRVVACVLAAVLMPAAPAYAAAPIPITGPVNLAVPPGTIGGQASDINEPGEIAGYVTVTGQEDRAVRWEASGRVVTLRPAPAAVPGGFASAITETGLVAGVTSTGDHGNVARLWSPDGTARDCATPPSNSPPLIDVNARGEALTLNDGESPGIHRCDRSGAGTTLALSYGYAIADDGQVAGAIDFGQSKMHLLGFRLPAVQRPGAGPMILPVPARYSGEAFAFGPGGVVVGAVGDMRIGSLGRGGMGPFHYQNEGAMIWRVTSQGTVETLGSKLPFVPIRGGHAVNRRGDIIGTAATTSGESHAVLWRAGRLTDLGTLGGDSSSPMAVNDLGQVVGTSTTAGGADHAFLWSDGRMIDLTAPAAHDVPASDRPLVPGIINAAVDINNHGQIVGTNRHADGTYRPVRWTLKSRSR